MDEKWVEQAGQDRDMVEDRAWLFWDWVAERTQALRADRGREDNPLATGKAQWVVKYPALLVFPTLLFGGCMLVAVMIILAGQ